MSKAAQQQDKAGPYSAVPPPSFLYSDSPQAKGSPISSDRDSEKKTRRRRSRRSQEVLLDSDGPSTSCHSGPGEGVVPRRKETNADNHNNASPLRSPSPSCMPSPSFRSKGCEITPVSVGGTSLRLEQFKTDTAACSSLKPENSGISCSPSSGPVGNNLSRSGSGIRPEYTPSAGSKSRSKESSPVPIPRPKWKEAAKNSKSRNDSSPSGKGLFPKIDSKSRYSQKVANKVDTPQYCNCAENAMLGPGLVAEEGRASNSYGECRSSGEDGDSGNSWQESKFHGSPTARFCIDKGRPDQKPRSGREMSQRSYYPPYWPPGEVNQALQAGKVFRSKMRVNSYNRSEAYISLDGIPTDILIDGGRAQNRAMDGDVVAIVINPVSTWPKLRGSIGKQNSNDLTAGVTDILLDNSDPLSIEIQASSSDEGHSDSVESRKQASSTTNLSEIGCEVPLGIAVDATLDAQIRMEKRNGKFQIANNAGSYFQEELDAKKLQSKHKGAEEEHGLVQAESLEAASLSNVKKALDDLASQVASFSDKRPTGEVVAILEKSSRREAVIGFLEVHQRFGKGSWEESPKKSSRNNAASIMFLPSDNRFPKMAVSVNALPDNLKKRLHEGDLTLGSELVAARVADWREYSFAPRAIISHSLGQGGEIEAQTAAILFEHAIHSAEFPPAALACLPKVPWKIPAQELKKRRDLRGHRIFSIDPPTARDLDDALSIEQLDNGIVRVGVHIADVSFFVRPDTALDKEAQARSTSVYLIQHVLPMLPRLLCEELCSLNPGVDRLAFSIIWDLDSSGEILDHWIGRTIIGSCCKLTYGHAQDIIDGKFDAAEHIELENCSGDTVLPEVHGACWRDVIDDVKALHAIANKRRDNRFEAGALRLDNSKLVFALDEDGMPCDTMLYEHKDSNFLVEEFMLLANMTVAKVISGAFPDCALLRRHPEPNSRKMKEFQDFCSKNGFELDASSSGSLHESLKKLREDFKEDPALCSIFMLYATKPMQLAQYFSTGELKDREEDWGHYALAMPFYTHFTSPIRRYPDIVVHRTLAAALEAEDILLESSVPSAKGRKAPGASSVNTENPPKSRCFTGLSLDRQTAESPAGQKALAIAASKHKVIGSMELATVAEHCNERKLASRNVRDASDKLYLWAMLKKKHGILSDARVLAVGPKFVSLYVNKIAMERRIYYEETEGLIPEWFDTTGTLILDIVPQKGSFKKQRQGRIRTVDDVALLVNPAESSNMNPESQMFEDVIREVQERLQGKLHINDETALDTEESLDIEKNVEPAVLPLTLRLLSSVPVYVYAVGGGNRQLDISVRFYLSSYLT